MRRVVRTRNLFQGLVVRFISLLDRRDPEALLDLAKESLRNRIGRFNEALDSHAALSERLMTQVSCRAQEQAELRAKIQPLMRAGHDRAAACYALQLEQVCRQLDEDHKQLESAEQTYRNLVRARDASVAETRARIEHVGRRTNAFKVDGAVADLESMAAAMMSELGGAGNSFNRLHEMVAEARDRTAVQVVRCGLCAARSLPE